MTTTAGAIHPEDESRMLSFTADDSPEQSRRIFEAQARQCDGSIAENFDYEPWLAFQEWLALGPHEVVVPYATMLAGLLDPHAVQMRRYNPLLLSLIKAHALLHQQHRERDTRGRIIATIADYGAVYVLVVDLIETGVGADVPGQVRALVNEVPRHGGSNDPRIAKSIAQHELATALGWDKSKVSRWARIGIEAGYLTNDEPREGHPHKLRIGQVPLPERRTVLPTPKQLEEAIRELLGPEPVT
jgi:hypothetical protein